MIPSLHMSLLGDFRLMVGETPVSTVIIPRVQSLLAYLVLHRDAPQPRSRLAFLLWPDSTDAQAHTNLRQLLYHLRQALPYADHFLSADRQNLQWRPASDAHFTLDVEGFEQALTTARQAQDEIKVRQALEQAAHLYRGDLLVSCYDEWVIPERDRLRQLFLQALERLMVLLEEERAYEEAIAVAQRLLRHDGLHEAAYRQLMRLHTLCGDRAAALRTYHTCASYLERELGIAPGQATRELYETLMRKESSSESTTHPLAPQKTTAPLRGRHVQWQQLQSAWRRAVDGHPHLVLLSGEAGIGKTRLAEEMEAWISRQGMITASARCYAAEGQLPYAPVTAWLRTEAVYAGLLGLDPVWLAELANLLPELQVQRPGVSRPTELREGWQRQRFFEALARALLSVQQPLLLLLDDLQWCDSETLEWLHYLFRFAPQACLLIISTVRTEDILPGNALVTNLRTWQPVSLITELTLEPLDPSDTVSLAKQIAGHPLDDALIDILYTETEGNPLFIVEMIRAGLLEQQEQSVTLPRPLLAQNISGLPPTVHNILALHLAQLSPQARELAGLAALIGREFTFTVLAHVSNEGEEVLVYGLDELWQRRIIRERGADAYDFSHEKLRQAALSSLSHVRQRFLHKRIAEALISTTSDEHDGVSYQIATHYEQANLPELAIPHYLQAARVASRVYAHEDALGSLQRAAALMNSSPRLSHDLTWQIITAVYELQGDIFEMIGKHREAEQVYIQARSVVPVQEMLIRARLSRKIAATCDYPPYLAAANEAYQEAEHLLEQVQLREEQEWRDEWLYAHLGHLQVFFLLGEWQQMTQFIERIQPFLERYGTAAHRATFLAHVAMRDAVRDRYTVGAETLSTCQSGLEVSLETGNPHLIGTARFTLGYCFLLSGKFDQAEEHLQEALTTGVQVGDAELVGRCRLHFLPLVWRRRGQVEAVRSIVTDALAQGERRFFGVITAQSAWLAWRDGKQEEAEATGRAAVEGWQRYKPVYPFQWTALWPLIALAVKSDQCTLALDYVRLLLDPTQQRLPGELVTLLEKVVQIWDEGKRDSVCGLLQRALQLAENMGYL